MNNKFKKILVGIVASAMCAMGSMGAISASAADFKVSHVNVPGAPSSESTTKLVTIGHRAAGATATVSGCENTDGSSTTGKTYFDCNTYKMDRVTIKDKGTDTLNPSVGSPNVDVNVTYKVSAYTPNSQNTYWSWGTIVKKS